jgi:hypothetical protein
MTDEAWVNVTEAARSEGVSERAVLKRIQEGRIPSRREGRRWLVQVQPALAHTEPSANEPGRLPPVPLPSREVQAHRDPRHSVQSLVAWQVCLKALQPALADFDNATGLRRRMSDEAVTCFEAISRGYHAFHYADKAARYHEARAALCSVTALAALAGDPGLASAVEEGPIKAVAALIRSMEKQEHRRGDRDA